MEEQAGRVSAIESLGSALTSDFDQLRQQQQSRMEQLSSLLASMEAYAQTATEGDESLRRLEESTQSHLDQCKQAIDGADDSRGDLEAQIQSLTAALETSQQEKAALEEQTAALTSQEAELRTALESAEQEKVALDERVQSLESEGSGVAPLEAELAEKAAALTALQSELDELRQTQAQEHDALNEARERANATEKKLLDLERDFESRSGDAAQIEARANDLQGEIDAKDGEIAELRATLQAAQEEGNQLRSEKEVLLGSQEQSEATQEGLKTELMSVQRELESLREKYKEGLSTEAALALRQQVSETAAQVKQLKSDLEVAQSQSKKSVLAQQLAEAIGESELLSEENDALRQELALLRDGLTMIDGGETEEDGPSESPRRVEKTERLSDDRLQRIKEAAKNHMHGPKRVMGQILCDADIISEDQLQQALELQKSHPQQHLGALLTEMGFASEEAIAQARASQCGVEFIRFDEHTVKPDAAALISERLANQHSCIPISANDNTMVLAVSNPMDLLAIEDVERFTNKKVDVVVGTVNEIASAITRFYWEPE